VIQRFLECFRAQVLSFRSFNKFGWYIDLTLLCSLFDLFQAQEGFFSGTNP
jgi:hypothetical protein